MQSNAPSMLSVDQFDAPSPVRVARDGALAMTSCGATCSPAN